MQDFIFTESVAEIVIPEKVIDRKIKSFFIETVIPRATTDEIIIPVYQVTIQTDNGDKKLIINEKRYEEYMTMVLADLGNETNIAVKSTIKMENP